MTGQEVAQILSEHMDERFIHPDQPMAEYTSFRTGGNALCVVEVHDLEFLPVSERNSSLTQSSETEQTPLLKMKVIRGLPLFLTVSSRKSM